MKRFFISVFATLLFVSSAWAQVVIDKQNRVSNFGPGYCAWCCLEMLGRQHNVSPLFNLAYNRSRESVQQWDGQKWISLPYVLVSYNADRNAGPWVHEKRNIGTDWGIYHQLNDLKIKYRMQWAGNRGRDIIQYAMKNKLGCCFSVKAGCFGEGTSAHAMILTNYTDKTVEFIDPNDIQNVYEASREWFDYWWCGWIVVIEKQ